MEVVMRHFRYFSIMAAAAVLVAIFLRPQTGMASSGQLDPELAQLIEAMKDPKPRVRRPAAYHIAHDIADPAPALDAMIEVLSWDDEHMLASALLAIGRIGPDAERAIPALQRLVEAGNEKSVAGAMPTLGAIGAKAVPTLAYALQHSSPYIAQSASKALSAMGTDAVPAIPALLEAARRENHDVSKSAMRALPYLGPEGVAGLASLLTSNATIQQLDDAASSLSMTKVDITPAIPALVRVMTDGKPGGYDACTALQKVAELAIPPLVKLVEEGSADERFGAMICLREIGPVAEKAIAPILGIATDSSSERRLRSAALGAVGRISKDNAEPVPSLLALLPKCERLLRSSVIRAIGHIGPAAIEALPTLLELHASNRYPTVRYDIIRVIGLLGPGAAQAVPALRKALQSPESTIRRTAAVALGRIGPNAEAAVADLLQLIPNEKRTYQHKMARSVGRILSTSDDPPPDLSPELLRSFRQGLDHRQLVRKDTQRNIHKQRLLDRQITIHAQTGKLGLVGIVKAPDGSPVPRAQVTLSPVYGARAAAKSKLRRNPLECDDLGTFLFEEIPFGKANLLVMAEGYAAHHRSINTFDRTRPIEVKLTPGESVSALVIGPDGHPVRGANVTAALSARNVTTDEQGRFTLTVGPRGATVVIGHRDFLTRRWRVSTPQDAEKTVSLKKRFHIKGTVTDAETGEKIPKFKIRAGWVMGANPHFPENERETPSLHCVDGTYEWKAEKAFEPSAFASSRVLAVEAPGYLRAVSRPFVDTDGDQVMDFVLKKASVSSGVILFSDGSPVAGAEVLLSKKSDMFRPTLVNGRFSAEMVEGPQTTTDAQGRFAFPAPKAPFVIIAQHDKGIAIVRDEELNRSEQVTMVPWARVKGQLVIGGEAAAGETVVLEMVVDENTPSIKPAFPGAEFTFDLSKPDPLRIGWQYRTETDSKGRFDFDRVKPGRVRLGRETSLGGLYVAYTHSVVGEAEPNRTLELRLDRVGRTVEGRVELPAPRNSWDDPCNANGRARLTPLGPRYEKGEDFPFTLRSDGSFRAIDIPPGEYELSMDISCDRGEFAPEPYGVVKKTVVVPPITNQDATNVALGKIELTRVNTLAAGDTAPALQMLDLNGTRTTLADYHGKLVLLHFSRIDWDPWAMMTDALREAYQKISNEERCTLISVYLETDIDRVRRFVKERKLRWQQFLVAPNDLESVHLSYGLHRLVNLFLINDDGTIREAIRPSGSVIASVQAALKDP